VETINRNRSLAFGLNQGIGETFLTYINESRRWQADLVDAIWETQHTKDEAAFNSRSITYSGTERAYRLAAKLINRLKFPSIEDRHERIAVAYRKTFEWIFHDPKAEHKPWTNYIEWLQTGHGIYWITGKAGSGKSTLMKHLYADPRTLSFLKNWAPNVQLLTAAFFFWNSGTKIQMSQMGLLRSLLYQVLIKYPRWAPSLFPERWETYDLFGGDTREWTWSELLRALKALAHFDDGNTKLSFFIDGLDEFDGEHTQLINLLKEMASFSHIKICVSSRPWVVFEEAFKHGPSLTLQDLTYPDIELFVDESFNNHGGFLELKRHDESFAQQLVQYITKKSSGVFLWVNLVVKSLLMGISSGDRLSDLQRRLDLLPPDLEDLFQKILDSLDPFYIEHASQLFQLVRASLVPPSLLGLSFADEEDPNFVLKAKSIPLSKAEALFRAETMKRRLNSRCKGLLEVASSRPSSIENLIARLMYAL
jgi:hypothetical protein